MSPSFILFLIILVKHINCFNIDTNYPIVYLDPSSKTNESSLFGYSLILHPGNGIHPPWIFIGAPRANNPNNRVSNSGVCFKCGIKETCKLFDFDERYNALNSNIDKEKLDNSWIGGSMDVNYKNDRVVTCAYRWIKITKNNNVIVDYRMQGSCYWFHVNDNTTQKLFPLYEPNTDTLLVDAKTNAHVYFYAQGQVGFSVHMPQNEPEMLLGAPGVLNWNGTPVLYKDNDDFPPTASRLQNRKKRYAESHEFSYKSIGNAYLTPQTVGFDFLGYSSSSGYYYNRTKLLYASGAPRSTEYKGQVIIYDFPKNQQVSGLMVKQTLLGRQLGEYFGASLTSGDINNDGLDDLIVGAPYFTSNSYNEGKVYIFVGGSKNLVQIPQRESIMGKSANGQFGSTVQYLGDIDHDGFGDIAVAAPYEENSGVIYIFRGSIKGLEIEECQRIIGKDISPDLMGFGMSISRPADIDFNRYLDIAIGAPLSGHAVLLRTRPSVTIYQSLESSLERIKFEDKSLKIKTCFWYMLDQMYSNISISRVVIVDQSLGRAHLQNANYNDTINLQSTGQTCQTLTIGLESSIENRYDPITITLSHNFVARNERKETVVISKDKVTGMEETFCLRCPVYNKYGSKQLTTITVPFTLGCRLENICEASLEFTPKIIDIGDTFVLDSRNYLSLETTITNLGEKAYSTLLEVSIPEIVDFRSIPSACNEQNATSVLCSVSNPLLEDETKIVNLDLDMSNLNKGKYDRDSFTIVVTVRTSSSNNLPSRKEVQIKLVREADITISGKSGEQSYSHRNITLGKTNFSQSYHVEKFGPSPLNQILVEINIPHMLKTKEGESVEFIYLFKPYARLGDQDINCESNFKYLSQEKSVDRIDFISVDENDSDNNNNNTKLLKRSLRQVEIFNESTMKSQKIIKENGFDVFENRTFYVNCSMPEIICSKVKCSLGSIKKGQVAIVNLRMLFDISIIKVLLGKKDVVLLATQGVVSVTNPVNFVQSGDRPDSVEVFSLFVGETAEEKVATWIIIVSVIAGLLLFLLVIMALVKCGFFKRATKEELEQLKKEMDTDNCGDVNHDIMVE